MHIIQIVKPNSQCEISAALWQADAISSEVITLKNLAKREMLTGSNSSKTAQIKHRISHKTPHS